MTDDPALAALTEALRTSVGIRQVGRVSWDDLDGLAAAILAHPAMADLARKARWWDETREWLHEHEACDLSYFKHDGGYLRCHRHDDDFITAALG